MILDENAKQSKSFEKAKWMAAIVFVFLASILYARLAPPESIVYLPYITGVVLAAVNILLIREILDLRRQLAEVRKDTRRDKKGIDRLFSEVQKIDDQLELLRLEEKKKDKTDKWERHLDRVERGRNYRKRTRRTRE